MLTTYLLIGRFLHMNIDTRSALIEKATSLVRRQGYSGFSYADLAKAIGIRKPSIHHHFPSKEDLGVAIVVAYTERFETLLELTAAQHQNSIDRLQAYTAMYRAGIETREGCLCGVLAREMSILPPRLQTGVRQFFDLNLHWLEQVLDLGHKAGELHPMIQAHREARTVLSTLQGAMSLAISLDSSEVFEQAVMGLVDRLRAPDD